MPQPRAARRPWLIAGIWIAAAVVSLPFLFGWPAPPPATGIFAAFHTAGGYLLVLALCYVFYRVESVRLPRRPALALVFLILLLAKLINRIHFFTVDWGRQAFRTMENTPWQIMLQNNIILHTPSFSPHAARFLPNAFVRWLEIAGWSFPAARDLYRLLFVMLVFYAVYRFARLFTGFLGAVIAMLLTAAIYPISFEYYVGQLTDPMSHLSFVLAFIFIERDDYPMLLTTLVIGGVAKESVLALSGYYVLFGRRDRHFPWKAGALLLSCAAIYYGVRLYVIGGPMHYKDISGVTVEHVVSNLSDLRWPYVYILTALALTPFLAIGWKETPLTLRRLALYLLPVLFISSTFFSWLVETRNCMPVVIVLAVATGCLFARLADAEAKAQ